MNRIHVSTALVLTLIAVASCSERLATRPAPVPSDNPVVTPDDSLLDANRDRWLESGVDSYRYRFRWVCFCVPDHVRAVDVTVLNGAVASVVDAETRQPLDAAEAANYRTILQLFDFLGDAIDRPAHDIRAGFDPTLGFPSEAYVDYVANIADEELGFRVDWVERLNLP